MTSKTVLLDSSTLIALLVEDHAHHAVCRRWFRSSDAIIASCPITQGAFARTFVRLGGSFADALRTLDALTASSHHVFVPDDLPLSEVPPGAITGHQQITDAYLAHLALQHGLKLATLDRAQAALSPDLTELIAS